nr:hypothetical protein GCM10025699_62020 [Microbacterium flavescens]
MLDGETLETEADLDLAGFNRLNASGDGRHVLVSTGGGWQVLDTGTWTAADGSHRVAEPALTDLVFAGDTPGHVVRHGGRTILFADGTGDTTVFETADLLDTSGGLPETETIESPEAHHGVSIELEDGTLLTTIGTPDERTGVRALDADRSEIARSEECPPCTARAPRPTRWSSSAAPTACSSTTTAPSPRSTLPTPTAAPGTPT